MMQRIRRLDFVIQQSLWWDPLLLPSLHLSTLPVQGSFPMWMAREVRRSPTTWGVGMLWFYPLDICKMTILPSRCLCTWTIWSFNDLRYPWGQGMEFRWHCLVPLQQNSPPTPIRLLSWLSHVAADHKNFMLFWSSPPHQPLCVSFKTHDYQLSS